MEQQKQKWWEMQWPRRHALAFPFGASAATALLTYLTTGGQGTLAANLKVAADMVDLAALIYGMAAVLIERGVRMIFWALDQRRQWRAALREEWREEGRQESEQRYLPVLKRLAQERGITVAELLAEDEKGNK